MQLCLVSLRVEDDSYGYDIIHRLSNYIDVSENAIYPILRRLTQLDYFKTYLKESNEGAPRKYYQMTEKGFEYYMVLRDEWDTFIGGVYQIIHKGGKANEEIFRRFKKRITETKNI